MGRWKNYFSICPWPENKCQMFAVKDELKMILLTKLNGTVFALNSDLIETIEENPDTVIRLTNKTLYIVKESITEVIDKVIEFRKASCGSINCITMNRKGEENEA
mgnify:CR=1 FL=1|jgi:flagellar protein FlbD